MIYSNSLGELAGALRRAGVSEQSIDIAHGILASIGQLDQSEDLPHGKNIKDRPNREGGYLGAQGGINLIPSEHKGPCHDLLITVCTGESNFDLNTMETIALCINCHYTIKAVIIASDYWMEKQFNKWRKSAFKALQDQFGIIFFVFTPHAGTWTVNSIAL